MAPITQRWAAFIAGRCAWDQPTSTSELRSAALFNDPATLSTGTPIRMRRTGNRTLGIERHAARGFMMVVYACRTVEQMDERPGCIRLALTRNYVVS